VRYPFLSLPLIRSRTRVLAITLGLGLVAAAVPGLRLRGEARVLLRGAGVALERVDEALVPHGDRLDADEGDLMLSDGAIQVVVGASSEPRDRRLEYGSILDVTGPGFSDDALGSIRTVLAVGGRRASLATLRVEAVGGKGPPRIRVTAQDPANLVSIVSDVKLRAKKETIEITTEAFNRGARAVSIRLGDDVAWPGVATFVPGYGEVDGDGRKSVTWLGRRGVLSYGLVFPDAPADVEFQANQPDSAQTCWGRVVELPPGASTVYRRVLVATHHGVSEVARIAAALTGQPIGHVSGVLTPAPSWAIVTAVASDGTIAMKESSRDDGGFDLALPPGRFTLVLQTPGGWDETVVHVRAGSEPTIVRFVAPQAERLDFRITGADGLPIPARLMVMGIDGTPDPRFASMPHVSAAGNEVHSVSGEGHVDIPPGRYRVTASRGVEWSVAEKTIDVKPEQGIALRIALSHDVPTPGWISADLHLHARPSGDSELPLDDRVASLVAAGVEFAVATDHNHVTDYDPTIDALAVHPLLSAARGVEVTTHSWGHFNAYPLPPGSPAPPYVGDPAEIFAGVRKLAPEAVIQVNHPWMPGWGYFHRSALNERTGVHWKKQFSFDFDLIEVANGYELGKVDIIGRNLHRYFDLLELGRRYTAVGSSDSHKLTNEWAGYPRTYVRVADDRPGHASPEEIATALRGGHAIVSLGPFIDAHVGTSGPGDTVQTAPGTLPLDLTVRAADWVKVSRLDVVVNGETIESFDVTDVDRRGSVSFARTVDVAVTHDAWIVVVATGERPLEPVLPGKHVSAFAFTNPIWVNVGRPEPEPGHPASRPSPRRRGVRPEPPAIEVPDPGEDDETALSPDASPGEPALPDMPDMPDMPGMPGHAPDGGRATE
jgi:hypothetical protein